MARTKSRICTVTGMKTSEKNFYTNQNHVKAVDNIRRNTDVTNFIVLKNAAGNIWGRLHPGEAILYCITPSVGMEVQADTASCVIEYAYWTKA